MRFLFPTAIERGDDEIELAVIYSASPRVAATYWQPAEGGEVELVSIRNAATGDEIDLTDAEEAALIDECAARMDQDFADDAADRADWEYQERRDRMLMAQWETLS